MNNPPQISECPVGTFKNVSGSDRALCHDCPLMSFHIMSYMFHFEVVWQRLHIHTNCICGRYHVPNCYTPLEELVYTFGEPWLFGLLGHGFFFFFVSSGIK